MSTENSEHVSIAGKEELAPSQIAGAEGEGGEIIAVSDLLPPNLALIPVAQTTIFPGMIVPLILPEGGLTKIVDHVMETNGVLGIVLTRAGSSGLATGPSTSMTGLPVEGSIPTPKASNGSSNGNGNGKAVDVEFHEYGVAAKVLKRINLPDNQVSILLTGLQRFRVKRLVSEDPFPVANVNYLYDEVLKDTELEALLRSALGQFKQISKDNPLISEELKVALVNIDGPGKLADLMASVLVRDVEKYQQLLAANNVKDRLQQLLLLLRKEQDVQAVQKSIQEEINQKVASAQREFYLQEQLKVIQRELGQAPDEKSRLLDKFTVRLKDCKLSKEAKKRIDEELEKLDTLHEQASEFSVAINYLDWATSLPWGKRSDENYDIKGAKKILEEDHFGLKEAKDRILEFLAVKKLKKSSEGSIICLVGPPGTGKTSLGKSIARALNRKFFRFSVGGMRDEAEIKGHRRTYVGALPGKIIQGLKRTGVQNPVFLIDEVDKLGNGLAGGGDPASALLEVLDKEQNKEFLDHYLDIPFDCSEIFFVTTANTLDTIPPALLDRTEVIRLHGYSDSEKFEIAKEYLIPRQMKENALKSTHIKIKDNAVRHIITHYAREAGVRNLEKQIAKLFRKVAFKVATGKRGKFLIDSPKMVEKFLGLPPHEPEKALKKRAPGVATGLAWTALGGEVLSIESVALAGKGGMTLTGSLGDVMQESANIAYSYVRNNGKSLNLAENFFERNAIHLHVPAGATPKDGPSAGVTMAASLYSLLSGKTVNPGVAMTGELTLTGEVLAVGGIKEKLLAAKRLGIAQVLIPRVNSRDLKEIEPELKKGIKISLVSHFNDCMKHLFPK